MNQPPPSKPGAPGPAKPGAKPGAKVDVLESSSRNIFAPPHRTNFQPTPLKRPASPGPEISGSNLRPPIRVGGGSPRTPVTSSHPKPAPATAGGGAGAGGSSLMPGATMAPAPAEHAPAQAQTSAAKPGPAKPPAPPSRPAASRPSPRPSGPSTIEVPRSAAKAAPHTDINEPPSGGQPSQVITDVDSMSYQGKLPLYVGTPADGNPMIDAEDAKFSFDPKGDRIRISCKVAAIMVKAACLHLGLPPPDRGPRRFILKATIRRESLLKHRDRLFDANLEVRLTAQEEGRPVLLDLTQFESFEVSPEA